jgi:hypothetical protein
MCACTSITRTSYDAWLYAATDLIAAPHVDALGLDGHRLCEVAPGEGLGDGDEARQITARSV